MNAVVPIGTRMNRGRAAMSITGLNRAGDNPVALVGQRVSAAVAQHVGMYREGEAGARADAFDQLINSVTSRAEAAPADSCPLTVTDTGAMALTLVAREDKVQISSAHVLNPRDRL